MQVLRYTPVMKARWDEFVDSSPNATFIHRRDYMDYHADRFTDASRMVADDKGRLVALMPANAEGSVVCSHRGLTYGGLLVGKRHFDTAVHLEAWQAILDSFRADGFDTLIYKPVPAIYASYPSDDDLYALFRTGASLTGCMTASAVPLQRPLLANQRFRRSLAMARKAGVVVAESTDFAPFWPLLEDVLRRRHSAMPVHSLDEMLLLRSRFPSNIRLFTASSPDGEFLGGIVVYFTATVAHTQYIAISDNGRCCGALAAIFSHVADNCCAGLNYFDFGTSCEEGGAVLNTSLNEQKYGMGGRPAAYTAWTIRL